MELTECAFGRNINNENKVIFSLVPLNTYCLSVKHVDVEEKGVKESC